jgi:UDP-hydrolysing UDP-N-acetyl-D-glucosamine 2-epimerase
MGEEPWRVVVSGAPSLDNLRSLRLLDRQELEDNFGLDLEEPPLLVTYHPVTLEYEDTESHITELMGALAEVDRRIVFTYPNADTRGRLIIERINQFVERNEKAIVLVNMGIQAYFSLMAQCVAMVGNSSSGIIEAASFKLPVVNIGTRQRGRIRGENVLDVGYGRNEILAAIRRAASTEFKDSMKDIVNPYGDGHAAEKIVDRVKKVKLDDTLILKRFYEPERAS